MTQISSSVREKTYRRYEDDAFQIRKPRNAVTTIQYAGTVAAKARGHEPGVTRSPERDSVVEMTLIGANKNHCWHE